MLNYSSPIEKIPHWEKCPCIFFTDAPFYLEKIPDDLKASPLLALLKNRVTFREFCLKNGIRTPEFTSSDKFEKLAAWAVSRNRFPIIIKTAQNLSDGHGIFLLKAFRELPEFHEKIAALKPGIMMIEEFVQAKGYLEATFLQGEIKLLSQISFEKSMRMRHSWRAFPVKLPDSIMLQIQTAARKFPGISQIKLAPVRFSFALTAPEITLLSINSGLNRPEYHPEWTEAAGINNIFSDKQMAGKKIGKLMTFYDTVPAEISWAELSKICGESLTKHVHLDDQSVILLCSENPATLLEQGKRADAFFKHLVNDRIAPEPEAD